MKIKLLFVALAVLLPAVRAGAPFLPGPARPYNFLMLIPVSSKSHRSLFLSLAAALTERGHKVTLLSNHPPADNNPNITYITHGLPYVKEEETNFFEIRDDTSKTIDFFVDVLPKMTKDMYALPIIQELYERRKSFDLIVTDSFFNELALPFVFEQSFITLSVVGLESMHSAVIGNIQNPAYFTTLVWDFALPMTFLQRATNLFMSIVLPIQWRQFLVVPSVQTEISKLFPSLPPLLELERNQSLSLINHHFSLSMPSPLVPAQVEIGCLHCEQGNPLPRDLESFVSGKEKVVYFSLGSIIGGNTMPIQFKKILLTAFSKLPYKIIWKFEDVIDDLPKNVFIAKWMPQQDILAHPNVKLFISHCGLLSSQEAMFHGTPVLALPINGDQPRNAKRLEDKGMARVLVWEDLTVELVEKIVVEMVSNPSYHAKISAVSTIFKDQLETPMDRAVFWTEYVIRHSGAVHLRSPERDLSWIQVLHLDILFVLHVVMLLFYFALKKLIGYCFKTKASNDIKKKAE